MYRNGYGVPQDYAMAVSLFQKAAEQGDADAQNNLGVMYEHGLGVPQDYVLSHMWLNLAASRGQDAQAV
jgi:TPR repeat protein